SKRGVEVSLPGAPDSGRINLLGSYKMKDNEGTYNFDGSELDNKATSLHNQFSTQLSLSSTNDGTMNTEEIATSPCPDKEVPSVILNWPLKSLKQDGTEEEAIRWRLE
ncbi:unnamed protein product, partial [Urochloa humidicola]